MEQLRRRCLAPINAFYSEGVVTETKNGPLIFKDNGASILGVAHLDTVQKTRHFAYVHNLRGGTIFSGQLDDRLGAFILLDLLPWLGIKCDVLLSDEEEHCNSTAEFFKLPEGKSYNWIFSFDRSGTDVVMYQYDNTDLRSKLKECDFVVGNGSYSDICEMDHLGLSGFNFGCGYYNNHSEMAYASYPEMLSMVAKFQRFYQKFSGTKMPFAPEPRTYSYRGYGYRGDYDHNSFYYGRGLPAAYDSKYDAKDSHRRTAHVDQQPSDHRVGFPNQEWWLADSDNYRKIVCERCETDVDYFMSEDINGRSYCCRCASEVADEIEWAMHKYQQTRSRKLQHDLDTEIDGRVRRRTIPAETEAEVEEFDELELEEDEELVVDEEVVDDLKREQFRQAYEEYQRDN